MLLWQLCAALQDLLLQPRGDTAMECGPGTTALLRHLGRAMTNSPLSPQCFTFSSVNSVLVQAWPWAGFQCFHPEPMCTSWSRFPCQQDQSYPAQSSFSHGI